MKRGFRRSADALKTPTYIEDKESGELRRPHHIDLKSGKYRGRQILPAKERGLSIAAAWTAAAVMQVGRGTLDGRCASCRC